jgi:4-hydroxy 2-oxovalerate aldolase
MGSIPIDAIEVGFRSGVSKGFAGAHYFTTDEYLSRLPLPEGAEVAVMTNAGDFLSDPAGPAACAERLYRARAESPVGMVRVAAHFEQTATVAPALVRLKELGYRVCLNLMQVSERDANELTATARIAADAGVDVFYVADSLGVLDRERVTDILETVRRAWPGDLGIHTHDNMLRALENSVAAVRAGAKWIDATVLGMGRGPGNVRTEFLLLQFNQTFGTSYNALPIIDLIRDEFEPLQRRHGWGPNPYYFLSAVHAIHPTYIQEMMGDRRYSSEDIAHAIEFLKLSGSQSFRSDTLHKATSFYTSESGGSADVTGWANGRPILLVARGPGASRHREGLLHFIERYRPIVIALNRFAPIPDDVIDAWAACHPMRLSTELGLYEGLSKPLIAPLSALPDGYRSEIRRIDVIDYGLAIESDR